MFHRDLVSNIIIIVSERSWRRNLLCESGGYQECQPSSYEAWPNRVNESDPHRTGILHSSQVGSTVLGSCSQKLMAPWADTIDLRYACDWMQRLCLRTEEVAR